MMKNAVIAAGLLALASSAAFAQQPAPPAPGQPSQPGQAAAQPPRPQFNPDAVRKADADRVSSLKAELRLTAEQEKKWPAAEAALTRYNAARIEGVLKMRDRKPATDPMAAAEERVESLQSMGSSMRAALDGIKPLYALLDEDQRQRLMTMSGFGGPGQRPPGMAVAAPGQRPAMAPPPAPQPQPAPPAAPAPTAPRK